MKNVSEHVTTLNEFKLPSLGKLDLRLQQQFTGFISRELSVTLRNHEAEGFSEKLERGTIAG